MEASIQDTTVQQLLSPTALQHAALRHALPHLLQLCTILSDLPEANVNGQVLLDAPLSALQAPELRVAFTLRGFARLYSGFKTYAPPKPVEELMQMLHVLQQLCGALLANGQVMRVRAKAQVYVPDMEEWIWVSAGYDGTNPMIWWGHSMMVDGNPQELELGRLSAMQGSLTWQSTSECTYVCRSLRVGRDSVLVEGAGSSVKVNLEMFNHEFAFELQLPMTWESLVAGVTGVLQTPEGQRALRAVDDDAGSMRMSLRHSACNFDVYKVIIV